MILLFRPHRLGFVQSRVSRFLIPVARRLVLPVIARRDARGPQSAARTCCLRTTSTGRKRVFSLVTFFAPAKKVTRDIQSRKLWLSKSRQTNHKHHPHPNPLPPAGEGANQKLDSSLRWNDARANVAQPPFAEQRQIC